MSRWQIGVFAGVLLAAVVASLPLYPFRWHLLLHIVGAVVFVGNIIVTAAWMILAERTREVPVLRFASRTVSKADLLFTGPGVILILLNGMAMAASRWGGWDGFHKQSWITSALLLFVLSGVVWMGFLLRYQFRMVALSNRAIESGRQLTDEFFSVLHRWYIWGTVATILPILSLLLMVFKPDLW